MLAPFNWLHVTAMQPFAFGVSVGVTLAHQPNCDTISTIRMATPAIQPTTSETKV
jgi:hypothetical protein